MSLPTARTPGYGTFRGRVACDCLRAWLPVYEAELKRVGIIRETIDIAQLTGGYSKSGGTHSQGGAADLWQDDARSIAIAEEMGAASWARTEAQGFDPHQHLVLNGCPHNGPARYQVTARQAGYNGLGAGGRGGRDPRGAKKLRTWTAGIRWAKARQKPKRLKLRVHVADQPKDFLRDSVVVRTGPGHEYPPVRNRDGSVKTVPHGNRFTSKRRQRSRKGDLWHQGTGNGWLPSRRLRNRKG